MGRGGADTPRRLEMLVSGRWKSPRRGLSNPDYLRAPRA